MMVIIGNPCKRAPNPLERQPRDGVRQQRDAAAPGAQASDGWHASGLKKTPRMAETSEVKASPS